MCARHVERAPEDLVDGAREGGICADSERERRDHSRREAFLASVDAEGLANVLPQLVPGAPPVALVEALLDSGPIAKGAFRGTARIGIRDAVLEERIDFEREMRVELVLEILRRTAPHHAHRTVNLTARSTVVPSRAASIVSRYSPRASLSIGRFT
jgi:hypothetical protein